MSDKPRKSAENLTVKAMKSRGKSPEDPAGRLPEMPQGEYLQFGGMAVPEGIMMRSPRYYSVACRAPNGQIVVRTEPLEKTWIGRQKWLMKPFLRGTFALLDTMALGNRAMRFASQIQMDAEYAERDESGKPVNLQKTPSKAVMGFQIALAVVLGLGIGFLIFNATPQAVAQIFQELAPDLSGTVVNYIAEVIKLIFFIGYLLLIRRIPAILEIFRYHGAEHKAINAMEANCPLDSESVTSQTRLHPRCGTNFAILVFLVGFLLFPLVPRYPYFGPDQPVLAVGLRVLIELALLPLVAGISYEIIRAAGKAKDQRWVNILLKPGLMTQFITTEEPNAGHIEVGIAALDAVVQAEETGALLVSDDYRLGDLPHPVPAGDSASEPELT